jgi:spermidine synthase
MIVPPLFLLSGATALLYQVAFGKKLATIFGATAYAVSAVLAAFMAGLALGSHLGGRYGKRVRRPLFAYGVAELAVGAVCALTPSSFEAVTAIYLSLARSAPDSLPLLSAVRGGLTVLVVAVPTVAMGLTLPLLARAVAGERSDEALRERSRRRLAQLYAVNTAGGAAGALLAAYFIIPALGLYATMRAAAVVNFAIGGLAMAVGHGAAWTFEPVASNQQERDEPETKALAANMLPATMLPATTLAQEPGWMLAAIACASGLLVFSAEVVDTHLLSLLIGNSTYAFGLMLAAFLSCLSVGAALAGRVDRRLGRHALPTSLIVSGVVLLTTVPLWGQLPRVFLAAGHHVSSWAGRELVRAGVAFGILALPTVVMGLTFPLLLRRVAAQSEVAARVGRLTAINTLGSIVGCIVCAYVLLPHVGSEQSLQVLGVGFAACGLAVLRSDKRRSLRIAVVALLAGLVLWLPSWDMKLMTNGASVYFDTQPRPDELLFVREDVHGGLTSVARRGRVKTLYTNGKFQGNDWHEVTAQRSFAHLPAMFVDSYDRALVIGLGTGTTLGTIASYPFVAIDVAEISPAIVEASQRYFQGPSRGALGDPRVTMVMNDGRNVLLLTKQRYDLITIELTSVWFAGAANLYSQQFYALCRDRMAPRGVLQQWVQLHHIRRRDLAVVLRTLRSAFSHVALFVSGRQGIVVASQRPLVVSASHLASLERRAAVSETLAGLKLEQILDRVMLSGASLDRFIDDSQSEGGPVISTDENLYLEYATPKGNVMNYFKSYDRTVALLSTYRPPQLASQHLRR